MSGKTESFELSVVLPVGAKELYKAWLTNEKHSAFTGGRATVVPKVGRRHTAWDGYIEGTTLELEPHRKIVQSWRTSEFPEDSEDSRLELLFEETAGTTKLTLRHSLVPQGQGEKYREGWQESYFDPMKAYFTSKRK